MADQPSFLVSFRGRLNDDASGGLHAAGIRVVSGHGGGTVAPGGDLPDIDHNTVQVEASSEAEAEDKVRDSVVPYGIFDAFSVKPLPHD